MWCVLDINQNIIEIFSDEEDAYNWADEFVDEECMIVYREE